MWTVESELQAALNELKPSAEVCRKLDAAEAAHIVSVAMARFVNGNPRVWWLALKVVPVAHQYEFPSNHLADHLPTEDGKCFWIPESGKAALDVYDVVTSFVPRVVELTPFFEYYALSKTLEHLAIETDHGALLVASRTA